MQASDFRWRGGRGLGALIGAAALALVSRSPALGETPAPAPAPAVALTPAPVDSPPAAAPQPPAADPARDDPAGFFRARIEPMLVQQCYECHSGDSRELKGGLRLDTATLLRKGGDSGPAIVPGKSGESLLMSAIRYEALEMPPTGRLSDQMIAEFASWIDHGAIDPRGGSLADAAAPPDAHKGLILDRGRDHWAFQPPRKVDAPHVEDAVWPRTGVDRFVLARLEQAGLAPSPDATPRALIRRLYYDLVGLPPPAAEVAEFERRPDEAAYRRIVETLLESPRFGERWARYWLDVARYADTRGYLFEEDRNYRMAYKYRDWVIAALNADMPYDKFIVSQLAGDQTEGEDDAPASGFLTLGRRFLNVQPDIIDDRIDVTMRGLMGLTVGCARCHDHKYDPILTADYYSLYGVFASSNETPRDDQPPALVDAPQPVEQVIFLRGNAAAAGPPVTRHFPSCLSKSREAPENFSHGSGRKELAERIASRDNPLTARVWVNRVWSHLFGRGLVTTPSDFGLRGEPPTHPELLDWLATTFMDEGWSNKNLIRRIVLSSAYRQASDWRPDAAERDPENVLLWRMNRRRLDLEAVRDSLLAASGKLDLTMGGASAELTGDSPSNRRAVYGFIERQNLPAFFRTFDFANPNIHTAARVQTNSPTQALFLLNNPFVLDQARALAKRVADEADRDQRVRRLFEEALARDPTRDELSDATAFLSAPEPPVTPSQFPPLDQIDWRAAGAAVLKMAITPPPQPLDRWEQLAQVLLMGNEFVFVD